METILKFAKLKGPIVIVLLFASLEFILILRHKSPYVSDSYFYNHIYYQFQGKTFDQSYKKIISKIDPNKISVIEKNFFYDKAKYKYSLSRYVRRPFYPFTAFMINLAVQNEYLSFLLPLFIAYLGLIFVIYKLIRIRLNDFWAVFGSLLFIGFNPFIDWSTYFLTDTIGAFFWLAQILLIYKYIKKPTNFIYLTYVAVLAISLTNREQSLLMFVVILFVMLVGKIFKLNSNALFRLKKLLVPSFLIFAAYLILNTILKQPSLYDSWIYLESNFGLYPKNYSLAETLRFLFLAVIDLHKGLLVELAHHRWWAIFSILGLIGAWKVFLVDRKPKFLDILMLSSSLASYIGLIIIPFLSYRYFYPTIIGIIYFSMYFLRRVSSNNK